MANIEIFDKIAGDYENPTRNYLFELFINEISQLELSGRLLDFGCGTGNVGIGLKEHFDAVCLLDPSVKMQEIIVDKINQYQLYNCYVSDIDLERDTNFNGSFDCIVVAQVLLHIPSHEQILTRLCSLLNDGGKLIIFDYIKNDKIKSQIVHNGFKVTELIELLETNQLKTQINKVIYQAEDALLGQPGELFMLVASN